MLAFKQHHTLQVGPGMWHVSPVQTFSATMDSPLSSNSDTVFNLITALALITPPPPDFLLYFH